MSALLEYAEQEEKRKGAEFSVLIPQTPDLFAFYRRFGYETRFYRHAFSVESIPAAAETLSASPVTAGGLASLRRANASRPFVQLNPKASQAVAEDLTLLKAECFATGRGYAVARKEKKQVFIEELFAQSPQAAAELVRGICGGLRLPAGEGLLRRRAVPNGTNHGLWHDKVFIETLSHAWRLYGADAELNIKEGSF